MYTNNFTNQLAKCVWRQFLSNALSLVNVVCGTQNDDTLPAVLGPDKYLCDTTNSIATTLSL